MEMSSHGLSRLPPGTQRQGLASQGLSVSSKKSHTHFLLVKN